MITVNLGTVAVATALTILWPSLVMPIRSYSLPMIYPAMFCRNNKGIPRLSQSWMNWVAFRALSEKRMPLLPRMPTG